jgi:replication factor C subunit 3/5
LIIERCWNLSGQAYAYAVIDEVDLLQSNDQSKLRALMDKYRGDHGFVFTTNNLHRVDGAIKSRCDVIEMPALTADTLLPLCKGILAQEGHQIDDQLILCVLQHAKGDIRTALKQLEEVIDQI